MDRNFNDSQVSFWVPLHCASIIDFLSLIIRIH